MAQRKHRPVNDNAPAPPEVQITEREDAPGVWTVEAIDWASEGEIYQAIFAGPDAEQRARDYARFAYGLGEGGVPNH